MRRKKRDDDRFGWIKGERRQEKDDIEGRGLTENLCCDAEGVSRKELIVKSILDTAGTDKKKERGETGKGQKIYPLPGRQENLAAYGSVDWSGVDSIIPIIITGIPTKKRRAGQKWSQKP